LEAYAVEGQLPVKPDVDRIRGMGLTPIRSQMISETATVRHDSEKLAQVVIGVIDRAVAQRAAYMRPAQVYEQRSNSPAYSIADFAVPVYWPGRVRKSR